MVFADSGLDVVGLLWGRDCCESEMGVRRVVGEERGDNAVLDWPTDSGEVILAGDDLRSEILSEESFRQLSYGLKLDLVVTGEEPLDDDVGEDFSRDFGSFSGGLRSDLALDESVPI